MEGGSLTAARKGPARGRQAGNRLARVKKIGRASIVNNVRYRHTFGDWGFLKHVFLSYVIIFYYTYSLRNVWLGSLPGLRLLQYFQRVLVMLQRGYDCSGYR